METGYQICAVAAVCAILCAVLRRYCPDYAAILSIFCCAAAVMAALRMLSPVFDFLTRLQALTGLEPALFTPLLKTAAIGILAQISGSFCQDAGEGALGKAVELAAAALALVCLLPLGTAVLETVQTMIGG